MRTARDLAACSCRRRAGVCSTHHWTESAPDLASRYAGAALHCWPNPTAALAEISRVLKPGGVFVGSTFLTGSAPLGQLLGDDSLVSRLDFLDPMGMAARAQFRWWNEPEMRDLFASVGLTDFQRHRQFRFILWCAQKPAAALDDA